MYRITMLGAVTALLLLLVAPPGALAVPTSDPDEIAKSESPDSSTAYHPVGMHIACMQGEPDWIRLLPHHRMPPVCVHSLPHTLNPCCCPCLRTTSSPPRCTPSLTPSLQSAVLPWRCMTRSARTGATCAPRTTRMRPPRVPTAFALRAGRARTAHVRGRGRLGKGDNAFLATNASFHIDSASV